jgi:2',3'-cyclic-nucleotide 2'-phosphodiesterase (5'-nucleotidase family)
LNHFQDDNENVNRQGWFGTHLGNCKTRAKQMKTKYTLLFDAGDMFQGTAYYNYFKGELMLRLMSAVGYDAGTIGNHEFDDGLKGIADSLERCKISDN